MLRQVIMVLWLAWKNATRSSLFNQGRGPKLQRGIPTGLLLRLLFFGAVGNSFWQMGARISKLSHGRHAGTVWLLSGVLFMGLASAFTQSVVSARTAKTFNLRNAWLDTLPISFAAQVAVMLLQSGGFFVYDLAVLLGAAPEWRAEPSGLLACIAVICGLHTAAALAGLAVLQALRQWLPAHRVQRLTWMGLVLTLAAVASFLLAPILATRPEYTISFLHPLARVVVHRKAVEGAWWWWLPAVAAASFVLSRAAERRGYDRIEGAPPNRIQSASSFDMVSIERLLNRRARSWVFAVMIAVLTLAGTFLALRFRMKGETASAEMFSVFLGFTIFFIAYVGVIAALNLASQSVRRDLLARPLLSTLPITPAETLRGKVAALKRTVLPALVGYVPILVLAWPALSLDLVWRFLFLAAALWLLSSAAVHVAFLSNGLAAPPASSGGNQLNFNSLLLFLPVAGVAAADRPLLALPPLLALFLIRSESARAAQRAVRWIDDSDASIERETPVWSALLVFSAFAAFQGIIARLVSFDSNHPQRDTAIAYALAAVGLVLLTLNRKPKEIVLALFPRGQFKAPLFLLAPAVGAASGAFALFYLHIVERYSDVLQAASQASSQPASQPGEAIGAFALIAVLCAPIAEEIFFRGWLLRAIESELVQKRFAFVLAALAFALVHPSISFLPVFVLGLATGFAYQRGAGLLVCMLMHATHNALVVWNQ